MIGPTEIVIIAVIVVMVGFGGYALLCLIRNSRRRSDTAYSNRNVKDQTR